MIFLPRIDIQFDVIRWNFSNLSTCLRLWLCLFMSTCTLLYYSFHFWAYQRLSFLTNHSSSPEKLKKKPKSLGTKIILSKNFHFFVLVLFDWISFTAYCCYIALFLYIPVHYILAENYPIVTRMIILIEQVT
jgi:hypothetical protein